MKKVLIVDDEPGVGTVLLTALGNDYDVSTATSGEQALELLARGAPDLILLDIDMPGMSGLEVLEQLREKNIKSSVIMLTSVEKMETAERAFGLGAGEYITKPFDINRVRDIVAGKLNTADKPDQDAPWKIKEGE